MQQSAPIYLFAGDGYHALEQYKNPHNPYSMVQYMAEINRLLQCNFSMIGDLEKRINSLVDLNEKIARELEAASKISVKQVCLLEKRPPEQQIIQRIFGCNEYSHCLVVKGCFKPLLYKDRNFNLFISLVDENRNLLPNSNSIPLKITAYSSGTDPEVIDTNKLNQPIFKGNTTADLTQGYASFQKLSFREVSSKFDRGVVHLVISVEAPPFEKSSVDHTKIRPLILRDVMVRAKKQI